MEAFLQSTLDLALASAPWLVLGLVAAGLIRAWLPMDLVGRSLGGSGVGAVMRAALIGAPLPLCSCGTLPAAISLRRSGASNAATTSFLIATPETGVDSVALTWVLLGPFYALLRPIAAILSAVGAGVLVGRIERLVARPDADHLRVVGVADSGCSGGCCGEAPTPVHQQQGLIGRAWDGLVYAFTDLFDDLAPWLAIGLLAAGAVVTLVPPNLLASWGSGPIAMLLIMLISVPMYVCATASTPLAHAMLYAGVSPGTVLVFLLAGPASNLAGIALVKKEMGKAVLAAYLLGVGGVSILLGLMLDYGILWLGLQSAFAVGAHGGGENELPILLSAGSLALLLALSIKPLRRFVQESSE